MAVITQDYDIDLKATGEYPVVKMSQFDTGSRTIVFTVYGGHDLAQIDGMVARVDGTRSDGVEFSSTCTVGTGSKVSFTISQEMTKVAGKHTAELVIFDADGNPSGTQNFIIEVEAATMVRDSAAAADDRTLYDQFTDSVSKTVTDKITSVSKTATDKIDSMSKTVTDKITQMDSKYTDFTAAMSSKADAMNKTVEDIKGLVGASSKVVTVKVAKWGNSNVNPPQFVPVTLQYDPVTALCVLCIRSSSIFNHLPPSTVYDIMKGIGSEYLPVESEMDAACGTDRNVFPVYHDSGRNDIYLTREGVLRFRTASQSNTDTWHGPCAHVAWFARGGKYIAAPTGTDDAEIGAGDDVAADEGIDGQASTDRIAPSESDGSTLESK